MQQAGLNIVAKWNADEVDAGLKAMNAKLSALKIPVIKLADGGSAATGINAIQKSIAGAVPFVASLRKEVKVLESGLIQLAYAGKLETEQGHRMVESFNARKGALNDATNAVKATAGAYAALQQRANAATKTANDLGAALGIESKEFKEASAEAFKYTDQLRKIDAASGRHFRNVGNYASGYNGISVSMSRIVGEMPNFSQSLRIGFMAISNNIQPLAESIRDLNVRNKELAAQGQPTTSALKAVGAAMFSWNTLLLVGVTALTAYGPKLIEYIKGNKDAAEETKRLVERKKELEQIDSNSNRTAGEQIGRLRTLQNVLTSNVASVDAKRGALKKLQDIYPSYFKNLDIDDIKNGRIADTINTKLVPALIAAAKARANQDKITKLTAENLDLEIKRNQENILLQQKGIELNKALAASKIAASTPAVGNAGVGSAIGLGEAAALAKAEESYNKVAKSVNNVQKVINANNKDINVYAQNVTALSSRLGNLSSSGEDTAKFLGKGSKAAATEAEKLSDAIKEINLSLQNIDKENELGFIGGQAEYAKKKFDLLQGAVKKLFVDLKQPIGNENIQGWLNQMSLLNDQIKTNEAVQKNVELAQKKRNASIDKATKYNERLSDTFRDLNEQLASNQKELQFGLATNADKDAADLKLLEATYKKLITTFNLPIDSESLQELFRDISQLKQQNAISAIGEDMVQLQAKLSQIDLSKSIGAITPSEAAGQRLSAYRSELNKLIEALSVAPNANVAAVIQEQIDGINNAIANSEIDVKAAALTASLENAAEDFIGAIGEGLGNALSGVGNIFDGIISTLGSAMQSFGKQLITASITIKAMQTALKSLVANPVAGVVAGVAMIAIGGALKNSLQKQQSKTFAFANGGIVSGPVNALVGEYPGAASNPEIIAPLNDLKKYIGGSQEGYVAEYILQGNDLLTVIKRTEKRNNR